MNKEFPTTEPDWNKYPPIGEKIGDNIPAREKWKLQDYVVVIFLAMIVAALLAAVIFILFS